MVSSSLDFAGGDYQGLDTQEIYEAAPSGGTQLLKNIKDIYIYVYINIYLPEQISLDIMCIYI